VFHSREDGQEGEDHFEMREDRDVLEVASEFVPDEGHCSNNGKGEESKTG
jgi:hypothetical protein